MAAAETGHGLRDILCTSLSDEDATRRLAEDLAAALLPGDLVALEGNLGAGKTALCRYIIRQLASDDHLTVPSPTFALMQPYEARIPIRHFDLYRLADPDELHEIGFFEDLEQTLNLVEWPGQADGVLPSPDVAIHLTMTGVTERKVTIRAAAAAAPRLLRTFQARHFLEAANLGHAKRIHVQGDASHRAYERIVDAADTHIFMNAPKTPSGDILPNGKSYAATVHRAADTQPFETIANALREIGFSAPVVHVNDRMNGYMLLEDFGSDGFLDADGAPIRQRYYAAIEALALLHHRAQRLSPAIVPLFDEAAFLAEAGLMPNHYAPYAGKPLTGDALTAYKLVWQELYGTLQSAEKGLILRDVHAPNLIWLDDKSAEQRVGFLDFQDALWGPQIYDVASLIYDARVTLDVHFQTTLMEQYETRRDQLLAHNTAPKQGWSQARAGWKSHMTVLAAQRVSKILGIFARLAHHDAKLSYLDHMPRNERYLAALLKDPILLPLRIWHATYLPLDETRTELN